MNKKPTAVLKAAGAFNKNPKREKAREGEPQDIEELKPGVGIPSEIKAAGLDDLWNEVLKLAHPGSISTADKFMVSLAVRLYHRSQVDFENMKSSDIQCLIKTLGELGLSPIQRTRLNVKPKEKTNAFTEL